MIFDEVKLKEIATILNGRAYKQNELLEDGKYKVLRVGNFFTSDKWYFSDLELDENKYCDFGDLLYAWSANFGPKIWNEGKTIFHYHIWKIELKENIDKNYLFYYLKFITDKLKNSTHGSVMMHLTKVDMENQMIRLPNHDNQKKIGEILSNIDSKIELNNKINDNLQKLAQLEFIKDIEDDENTTKCLMDEIFYQITPGTNYQPERVEKGIPFLNVKNINNGYIDFKDSKYITDDDYKKVHKTWQPEENDLLISRIGTLGLVAVIRKEDLPLAVHYNFLDLKTDAIPFEFGYFLLKSDYFQTKYRLNIKNSVQEYVTVDDIRKIEIVIPSKEKMEKYKDYYGKIVNIQRENRSLEQLRDTLLPKLMNGEIDLDKIEI